MPINDLHAFGGGNTYRLLLILHQLLGIFLITLYLVMAERWRFAPDTIAGFLARILKFVLVATLPIAAGVTVVGPQLVVWILGAEFEQSDLVFQMRIWNPVLVGVNGIFAQLVMLMSGRQRAFLLVVSIGTAVSLLLNILLIPLFSYVGAALAWVLAEVVVLAVSMRLSRTQVRLRVVQIFWRPALAAGIMGFLCWLSLRGGVPLLVLVAIGSICYPLALVAIGGGTPDDWRFIQSPLTKQPRKDVTAGIG